MVRTVFSKVSGSPSRKSPRKVLSFFAGTQAGLYRSDDRGDHWEALDAPRAGMDVWSLTAHPHDANVIFANELNTVIDPIDVFSDSGVGAYILADHAALFRRGYDQIIGRAPRPVEQTAAGRVSKNHRLL